MRIAQDIGGRDKFSAIPERQGCRHGFEKDNEGDYQAQGPEYPRNYSQNSRVIFRIGNFTPPY